MPRKLEEKDNPHNNRFWSKPKFDLHVLPDKKKFLKSDSRMNTLQDYVQFYIIHKVSNFITNRILVNQEKFEFGQRMNTRRVYKPHYTTHKKLCWNILRSLDNHEISVTSQVSITHLKLSVLHMIYNDLG